MMFANWDWISFGVGVLLTVVFGGGIALLFGAIGSDWGGDL